MISNQNIGIIHIVDRKCVFFLDFYPRAPKVAHYGSKFYLTHSFAIVLYFRLAYNLLLFI
jgi:hypothetical protein